MVRDSSTPAPWINDAVELCAGDEHACARGAGGVVCWGSNLYQQLGAAAFAPAWPP